MIVTIHQNIARFHVTLIQNVTKYHVTIGQEVNQFNVSISQNVTRTVTIISQLGERGLPGIRGLSNYEIAVNNGFPGTEPEWLLSLRDSNVDGGLMY